MDTSQTLKDLLKSELEQIKIYDRELSCYGSHEELTKGFKEKVIQNLDSTQYQDRLKEYFKKQIDETTNHTLSPELLEKSALEAATNEYNNLISFIKQMEIPKLILKAWENNKLPKSQGHITAIRLFQNSPYTTIASSMPIVSGLEAIIKKHLWQDKGEQPAVFKKAGKQPSKNYIVHYITSPGYINILPFKEAQEIINYFSLDAGKLHLLFSAYCMQSDEPWRSEFTLKASDILKIFKETRKDLNKSEKLQKIAATAFCLDSLLVKAEWEDGVKQGKVTITVDISRMWNISLNYQGQRNIFGEIEAPEEIYITVQPGLWSRAFLNKAGHQAKEALYQFGYISQELFKLNAYRDEFVLRGIMYLTLASRYHANGRYKVLTLLSECIGIIPEKEIAKAKGDRHSRLKLKKRWDNFLTSLDKMGWNIIYDAETYPEWLRPQNLGNHPPGYFEQLLEARITVLPPDEIPRYAPALSEKKSPRLIKPQKKERVTAAEIKAARLRKGWSQRKLAGFLGVSPSLICLIEKGSRTPDPKLVTQLGRILEINL